MKAGLAAPSSDHFTLAFSLKKLSFWATIEERFKQPFFSSSTRGTLNMLNWSLIWILESLDLQSATKEKMFPNESDFQGLRALLIFWSFLAKAIKGVVKTWTGSSQAVWTIEESSRWELHMSRYLIRLGPKETLRLDEDGNWAMVRDTWGFKGSIRWGEADNQASKLLLTKILSNLQAILESPLLLLCQENFKPDHLRSLTLMSSKQSLKASTEEESSWSPPYFSWTNWTTLKSTPRP